MNYHLHDNGWTVIADVDLKTCTQEDINQMARLLATNTCLVVRNQHLSVEDELRVIKMFKDPETYYEESDDLYEHYHVTGTGGLLARVTGEKDSDGVPGLASFVSELDWHCNVPYRENRRPLIWLYGVHGTAGSRTSWTNNVLAYNDLPDTEKEYLKTLKAYMMGAMEWEQKNGTGYEGQVAPSYIPNVVHTNNAGKTGMFFPFLQMSHFEGMTPEESQPIIKKYGDYITQDKYCYHHDWQDGDLVISEQWHGIHKRWPFEDIEHRMLHRGAFDFPDQDYTKE